MEKGLTIAKAATMLHCHPNTIKRIEKRLKLPVKRDYRNYRIYSQDVIRRIRKYMNTAV